MGLLFLFYSQKLPASQEYCNPLFGQWLILMISTSIRELCGSNIQNPFSCTFRNQMDKSQKILTGIPESHSSSCSGFIIGSRSGHIESNHIQWCPEKRIYIHSRQSSDKKLEKSSCRNSSCMERYVQQYFYCNLFCCSLYIFLYNDSLRHPCLQLQRQEIHVYLYPCSHGDPYSGNCSRFPAASW